VRLRRRCARNRFGVWGTFIVKGIGTAEAVASYPKAANDARSRVGVVSGLSPEVAPLPAPFVSWSIASGDDAASIEILTPTAPIGLKSHRDELHRRAHGLKSRMKSRTERWQSG
jgi:hypothetical protein